MTCPICATEPPADGLTCCQACLARIDHDLERIAELTRHAADRLIPETRPGNGGRSLPASRPPLDVAALDDACGVDTLRHLEDWCRLIREEAGLAPYGAATEAERVTVGSLVTWLRSWLLWASERPDFPLDDLATEVRDLRGRLERYDPNHGAPPAGIPVPCPADHPDGDGRGCDYRLRTDGAHVVVCPRCHTHWTPDDLLDPLNPTLLTPDQLITLDAEPNPRERLRNWTRRGRITPAAHATNPNGGHDVPLYRLGDYRALIADRKAPA